MEFTSSHSDDFTKLTEIYRFLSTEYDVPRVSANRHNGKTQSLVVFISVPLAIFENKTEKELIRQEVLSKVNGKFKDLEQYGELRVVIASGFNIGIAKFNISD
jgi:hypothetical protein